MVCLVELVAIEAKKKQFDLMQDVLVQSARC